MMLQSFVLQPFQMPREGSPALSITGQIERQANFLEIVYQVQGELSNLVIPAKAESPARQDNLWESTCFECFFGPLQKERYWEVNLSPNGDWNVYHFDRYREGIREEKAVTNIPFHISQSVEELQLNLHLNLERIISVEQHLEVAITVVTQSLDGEITYWALTHTGTEADFHRRDSFTIRV